MLFKILFRDITVKRGHQILSKYKVGVNFLVIELNNFKIYLK